MIKTVIIAIDGVLKEFYTLDNINTALFNATLYSTKDYAKKAQRKIAQSKRVVSYLDNKLFP